MTSEWNHSTINDVCVLVTDGSHSSPKSVNDGKYMVSVKDFTDYGFDFASCRMISNDDYETLKRNGCVPQIDDILIGKDGARFFEDIIIYRQREKPALLSSIAILRCDKSKILPDFLYYVLRTPSFRQDVKDNYGSGSAIPRIILKDFKRMMVSYPSLEKQQAIISVLTAIDSKIQANTEINDNLRQQAQALFKKWFVDNPDAILWKEGTFSNLIEKTISGDWGKDSPSGNNTEMVYCIRGADIPEVRAGNKGKMPTRYILPKNYAAKQLVDGDIVVEISGGSPTQSTGRAAAVSDALLARYDKGMVCTNFCKALKPRAGYSMYVYYYWQYLYDRDIFFSYENGTTGIKNLDINGFIETEPIVIAPEDLVEKFDAVCQTVFSKIYANGMENEQLALVRDTILPKLMSGEIDVSAVQL